MAVWNRRQKDMLQKRTKTAKPRTIKLGKDCKTFALLVYYDMTHKRLDGAAWLPEGQSIPDVQAFANKLLSAEQAPQREPLRRSTRTRTQGDLNTAINRNIPRRSTRRGRAKELTSVLPEITVAGSDTESNHNGDGMYSVPVTPAPAQSETGRASCGNVAQPLHTADTQSQQREQAHNAVCHTEDFPNAQQDDTTSEDAEGEPQEAVGDHVPSNNGGAGSASTNFPTMTPNSAWMQMPIPDAPYLDNMNDNFSGFDLGGMDITLDTPDQESPSPHHQVAEMAAMMAPMADSGVKLTEGIFNEQGAETDTMETSQVPTAERSAFVMPQHTTSEGTLHPQSHHRSQGSPQHSQPPQQPAALSHPHDATRTAKITQTEYLLRLRVIRDAAALVLPGCALPRNNIKTPRRHSRMSQMSHFMQPLPALGTAH
ncbi:hypothetical protein B0T10DRAFT_582279 [Thelonectria olida]|uniref:Uncharacterized protein n=1 Tax=Thelonectria olida TaxID=1576542 RepID=A0A9P8VX95_9HYPO|nr:hypothetical protein B0T10DRAFT_582279 [Thelonectria olida]